MSLASARLAVPLALLLVGCKNDYGFIANDYPELETDHGSWLSMDVAPDGRLAIAFYDRTKGALGFALGKPLSEGRIGWTYEQVDGYASAEGLDPGDRGTFASLAVAPDGNVWVAYHDVDNGLLRVAKRQNAVWQAETLDAGDGFPAKAGHWASIAIADDGNPVIVHHDVSMGTLRSCRNDGSAWSCAVLQEGEDWTGTDDEGNAITREADVGEFARLHVHAGTEYIAYYDAANQSLELLEGFPGAYAHSTVATGVDVGQWPSIWTDGSKLAIAFHDVENQDLLVATRDGGGSFTVETVDDGDFVGADTEIFRKGDDLAVVYFDGRNNDMKLATRNGGAWTTETVAGTSRALGFHNEVAYTGGTWYAASYDFTNRKIFANALK